MNAKVPVIYYFTEDLRNPKEHSELEYLRRVARVVLVTVGNHQKNGLGLKQINVAAPAAWIRSAIILWSRACLLLCRLADSKMDQEFPIRNVYLENKILRHCVNLLWEIKRWRRLNACLPSYDALYFLPMTILHRIAGRTRRNAGRFSRIAVHDALLVRLHALAPLIAQLRMSGARTIGIVKSWDNPYYSQLATRTDGYFVWSESMWHDIRRAHKVESKFVHAWGARPFAKLLAARKEYQSPACEIVAGSRPLVIGYAAAFSDTLMVKYEIDLIKTAAAQILRSLPDCRILFRPYPTLPDECYSGLKACRNIMMLGIAGEAVDRFGDGRELIRFGSETERMDFLARCDCFLSLATTFTIEAAILRLPIIHLYLDPCARATPAEHEVFNRIDINDHLIEYFVRDLEVAHSYDELMDSLRAIKSGNSKPYPRQEMLLRRLGITDSLNDYGHLARALRQDLTNGCFNRHPE